MSSAIHPGGLGRILSQIRFVSTFNIAASWDNPARPRNALRVLYSERLVASTASVLSQIGYRSGMVVHAVEADTGLGIDAVGQRPVGQ